MAAREELFRRLSEGDDNAEQVSVRTDREAGVVEVELEGTTGRFDPDEARTLADDLEENARDEGWYNTGQTKPLLEEIRESAESLG